MRFEFGIVSIFLIMLCMSNSGCLQSDWEYEYYYYVSIFSNSTDSYTVMVPLPRNDHYYDDFNIEYNCTYRINESGERRYLEITGTSHSFLDTSFEIYDGKLKLSLIDDDSDYVDIYSDSPDLSIIVDSRGVRKDDMDPWLFYHSAIIDPVKEYPIPDEDTWKDPLPEVYSIQLRSDWHSYNVTEEFDKGDEIR